MVATPDVRVRRVFDKADDQDGVRVLVDRVWPRWVGFLIAACGASEIVIFGWSRRRNSN